MISGVLLRKSEVVYLVSYAYFLIKTEAKKPRADTVENRAKDGQAIGGLVEQGTHTRTSATWRFQQSTCSSVAP